MLLRETQNTHKMQCVCVCACVCVRACVTAGCFSRPTRTWHRVPPHQTACRLQTRRRRW